MASVELVDVTVGSGASVRLDHVTLPVPDGAFVAVVGGSGSGKTSLLRAIAGLDQVAGGAVWMDERNVTATAPGARNVAMVFQSPALIEHLGVRRNVAFPLEVRRLDPAEVGRRVDAEVRALHIEGLLGRPPSQLSQGEQQMVQIARSLVRVPTVLLLDEPFASLDDSLRRRMRAEIAMLQSGYGVTTVMATNDSDDVVALASMVAVLDAGRLVQWGPTDDVRRAPGTLLAAVATGPLSLTEMTVIADRDGFWLQREDPVEAELVRIRSWTPDLARYVGRTVNVGLRPEDVEISSSGTVPARVAAVPQLGAGGVSCTVAGIRVTVTPPPGAHPTSGDAVLLRVHRHLLFDRANDQLIR